ncbi:MAG: FAD-dependent oxidoreductase [Clostridia bacterium]|nr:FAD-dependent oxidoreductase [Clostridia bacterium]
MQNVSYQRNLPVSHTCDVLVVGGGPAGFCAAVAAARAGADTVLVEQHGYGGGMATAGLVAPFMTCYDSAGDTMLIRGLFEEVVDRLCKVGGAIHPSKVETASAFTSYLIAGHVHVTPFKAESLKLVIDEMLREAGVKVLYHTAFVDAEMDGDRIAKVIVYKKEGLCAIDAKMVIDCSGDADVAEKAKVPYLKRQEKMQPASLFFRIGNVDSQKIEEDIAANKDNFYRKNNTNYRSLHWWVSKAREAGDWTLNRVSIGLFRGVEEDEWSINTSRIMGVDGTDSESLTEGEIVGRQQVDEIFRFFVKYVPGCENARLLQSGSTLGIRETRHIEGIKTLKLDDLLNYRVPEDSILLAANSVDVHGKYGPTSNEYITLPAGKYYGIPYGCLVPKGCSNLLVAGRSISAEPDAAGAIRVMPPCMAFGQAAGIAAAMAIRESVEPKDVDVQKLRAELIRNNACL